MAQPRPELAIAFAMKGAAGDRLADGLDQVGIASLGAAAALAPPALPTASPRSYGRRRSRATAEAVGPGGAGRIGEEIELSTLIRFSSAASKGRSIARPLDCLCHTGGVTKSAIDSGRRLDHAHRRRALKS